MIIEDKKVLMRELSSNLEYDTMKYYEFGGYTFTREGETTYQVFNETGDDEGIFDITEIYDSFIKKRVMKKKIKYNKVKPTSIKKKGRKKKNIDLIIIDFMRYLHSQQCVVEGCCDMNIEAHHVFGRQPYRFDNLCVPLCPDHHRGSEFSWHEGNVRKFRKEYNKERLADLANNLFKTFMNEEGQYSKEIDLSLGLEIIEYIENRSSSASQAMKELMTKNYISNIDDF